MKFKNASDKAVFLSSTFGHCMTVEPGTTVAVHPTLERAAFDARMILIEESVAIPESASGPTATDRAVAVKAAVESVIATGKPKDFTLEGHPRKAAIDALLSFKSTNEEVGAAYAAVVHGT